MRELFKEREAVKTVYLRKEYDLNYKKEKLFKVKNPSKWGCTSVTEDELVQRSEDLFKNKEKAFKFMLTDETTQLNFAREEVSFYTNQCLDEVRRVNNDNGVLMTSSFTTMSQT